MLNNNKEIEALDIIAYFSFFMGLVNYDNIIKQSDMQEVVKSAVEDIHKHLKFQDEKIDVILDKLGGVHNE